MCAMSVLGLVSCLSKKIKTPASYAEPFIYIDGMTKTYGRTSSSETQVNIKPKFVLLIEDKTFSLARS